ncbi:hypothetical protein TWF281_004400 [Arthrobotrys megalospora]
MLFDNYNLALARMLLLLFSSLFLCASSQEFPIVSIFAGSTFTTSAPYYYRGPLNAGGSSFVPGFNCNDPAHVSGTTQELTVNGQTRYHTLYEYMVGCQDGQGPCCPKNWIRNGYYGAGWRGCPPGYFNMDTADLLGSDGLYLMTKSQTVWPCCPELSVLFPARESLDTLVEVPRRMAMRTIPVYDNRTLPVCAYTSSFISTAAIGSGKRSSDTIVIVSHTFLANPIFISTQSNDEFPELSTTSTSPSTSRTSARPGASITSGASITTGSSSTPGTPTNTDAGPANPTGSDAQVPQTEGQGSEKKSGLSVPVIVGISLGVSIPITLMAIFGIYWYRRRSTSAGNEKTLGGTDDAAQPGIMEDTGTYGGICDPEANLKKR